MTSVCQDRVAGEGFVSLVSGKEWLGSFGVERMFVIVLFGLLGRVLNLKRRGRRDTHPVQSVFFAFLILGVVLGLA